MADTIDQANKTSMHLEQVHIQNVRNQGPVATATGKCLSCGNADIQPGRRWCDKYCAQDWEKLKKNGVI